MSGRRVVSGVLSVVDLILVVDVTTLLWGVLTDPSLNATPLQVVVGAGYVLFVPGYALVSALVPEANDTSATELTDTFPRTTRFDGVDRLLLAVAVSIALAAPIGLLLGTTAIGFTTTTLAVVLSTVTVLCCVVATIRRLRLPGSERFEPRVVPAIAALFESLRGQSRNDLVVNAIVVCSVFLLIGSVGYAIASSQPAEPYTEFYVLAADDQGEYAARDYVRADNGTLPPLRIGVTNREHRRVDYTAVVFLQRVEPVDADGGSRPGLARRVDNGSNVTNVTLRPVESVRLDRYAFSLTHTETWQRGRTVSLPTDTDPAARYRLTYLLYRGQPPETPTTENAYRYLWIDLASGEAASTANETATSMSMLSTSTTPRSTTDGGRNADTDADTNDDRSDRQVTPIIRGSTGTFSNSISADRTTILVERAVTKR